MIKQSLFYIPVFIFAGISTLNAANSVPLTNLTKNCKPIINRNLVVEKVGVTVLSDRVHKRLNRALKKMSEEKNEEAILLLKAILENSTNRYVQSTAAKYIGIAYSRLNNSIEATIYFEKSLNLGEGNMPYKELQELTQNVASMHYSNDNKSHALKYIERWIRNSNVDSVQVYLLYAATLMDSGQFDKSICPAYWSAKLADSPNKSALNILLNTHYQLQDYTGTIAVLKQLIMDFSEEKRYWRNLASMYISKDKLKEALVVMELFYLQGMMDKENDYKVLSQMFSHNGIPYRTANILKEGIDRKLVKDSASNWNDIASNYHLAGELKEAIDAYAKSAIKSDSGEIDLKRAELLADIEQFERAIIGFDRALQKGSLPDPGKAYFRKGLALYGLKRYDRAISTLEKANKYNSWRSRAGQWAQYISRTKK